VYWKIQVVIDALDPGALAEFWRKALGYAYEPPPPGFATWEEFGHSIGMPEEQFGDQASLIDPEGAGPRIFFQRVPEGKSVKNRLHLDVRVAGRELRGEDRQKLVDARVAELIRAGATEAWRNDRIGGRSVVMRDPEGNEFCVS
jgi:glyoxalase superfamily protein